MFPIAYSIKNLLENFEDFLYLRYLIFGENIPVLILRKISKIFFKQDIFRMQQIPSRTQALFKTKYFGRKLHRFYLLNLFWFETRSVKFGCVVL